MKAEIKTTTEERTIKVHTERVHLDLSIQEAHLLNALLGSTSCEVAKDEFGVSDLYQTWAALNCVLDLPNSHGYFSVDYKRFHL